MRKNVRDFPVGAGRPLALATLDIDVPADGMGDIPAHFMPMQAEMVSGA